MRVIYRSASKRRLTSSTGSVTRDVLVKLQSVLPALFRHLGSCRTGLVLALLSGSAWLSLLTLLLPWAGPLATTLAVWRRWAVPWISYFLSKPGDKLETTSTLRRKDVGADHLLITIPGSLSREHILAQLSQLFISREAEPERWKLTSVLIRLFPGCWVWRPQTEFRVQDHVTFCEEVWRGAPLNEQSLKYRVNELCGSGVQNGRPPWKIHVVPFVQSETRSNCHALLVRSHHLLAHLFRPEDFYWREAEDTILREAVVNALSSQNTTCYEVPHVGTVTVSSTTQKGKPGNSKFELQNVPNRHREVENGSLQQRPSKNREKDVPSCDTEIDLRDVTLKDQTWSKGVDDVLKMSLHLWNIPKLLFHELLFYWYSKSWSKHIGDITLMALFLWEIPGLVFHEILCSVRNAVFATTKCRRALSWSDPISSELLSRIQEASGAESIEAVLYSCLAGAINYYRRIGGSSNLGEDYLRALQPASEGFLGIFLPVGEPCPKARLRKVQRSIQRGQRDHRLPLSHLLVSHWRRLLPEPLARFLANLLARRYPVLLETLEVGDSTEIKVQQWKIRQVDVGLSLSLVHHVDHVTLCVMSDVWTVERPDLLAVNFDRAVVDLALSLGVRCERRTTPPGSPLRGTPPGTPTSSSSSTAIKVTPSGTPGSNSARAL